MGELVKFGAFGDEAPELRFLEGDWRMGHIALSKLMGYSHHKELAKRIKRHWASLKRLGFCATVAQNPGVGSQGGRPIIEFWLNEAQCNYIAAACETPLGNEIRLMLAKVFDLYRKGLLTPVSTELTGVVRFAIGESLVEYEKRLISHLRPIEEIARSTKLVIDGVAEHIKSARKDLSRLVMNAHRWILETKFDGECPVCREAKLVVNGAWVEGANKHHQFHRNNRRFDATIVACVGCHDRYHNPNDSEFKRVFVDAFNYYQRVSKGVSRKVDRGLPATQDDLFEDLA